MIVRKRVGFAHDFFRSPLLGQANLETYSRWLHNLFASTIAAIGGSSHCLTGQGSAPDVPVARALHDNGWPAGLDAWVKAHSADQELDHTYESLRGYDFVVGLGLTPSLIRFLARANIPFLDVVLDEARFASDYLFIARTNDDHTERALQHFELGEDVLLPAVGLLRARIERAMALRHDADADYAHAPIGATMFVGQGDIDTKLIADGRLAKASDFIQEIESAAPPGGLLLLKPHPQAQSNGDIQALHRALPSALVITDNIYALLQSPLVGNVVTLSSSVAYEAKFFGKPAQTLIVPDRNRLGDVVSRGYRLSFDQMQTSFWRSILGNSLVPEDRVQRSMAGELRKSYGYSWGFTDAEITLNDRRPRFNENIFFAKGYRGHEYFGFGWHELEDWGCWSSGGTATLLLQLGKQYRRVAVRFELSGFVPTADNPLRARIYARGARRTTPQQIVLVPQQVQTVDLMLDLDEHAAHDYAEIVFEIMDARSPSAFGSTDSRTLGVGLRSMSVSDAS